MNYRLLCFMQIGALDPEVIKMGAICLISCLLLRMIVTFLVSFGCGLNNKEKFFIGVTWLAKATVQVKTQVPDIHSYYVKQIRKIK